MIEAAERWAFLAGASQRLAEATDYEHVLETIAALAIPRFGSWTIVHLAEADGSMRRLRVVHPDPGRSRHSPGGWRWVGRPSATIRWACQW